ncbi:MAG: NifU family protein [Acidimicrobiales bacterium]|jgi:Fe/S biogenesis protein NfuA
MTDHTTPRSDVLHASEAARDMVLALRASEENGESLALWIEVTGASANAYTYDIYFQALSDVGQGDWSEDQGGLTIVVPAASLAKIRGSVLDVNPDDEGGMFIENPNRPPRAAAASPVISGPPPDLSGDVAQRVLQVLEMQINPSIAAHGGRADLVAVQEDVAYLRLSGGCAGCGMAAVTLSQGIEVALRESVREISRIVDVTDHASGTNPYYEAAKK